MSALYASFAVQKNEIRRTEGVVPPKIFSPPSNLKLSVELVEEDTSDLEFRNRGIAVARERKKKKLYGWAVISECDIRNAGLRVVIDNNPGSSGFRVDEGAGGRGVRGSKATVEPCVTRTCTRGF